MLPSKIVSIRTSKSGDLDFENNYGYDSDKFVSITLENGYALYLYHARNCCESVYLSEGEDELSSLVGETLISYDHIHGGNESSEFFEKEWNFVNIVTDKSSVQLRFDGSHNGYYSVSISSSLVDLNESEDDSDQYTEYDLFGHTEYDN